MKEVVANASQAFRAYFVVYSSHAHAPLAQQISGTITGVVKDSQQALSPTPKSHSPIHNWQPPVRRPPARTVPSCSPRCSPARYNLAVESTGFKKFEQTAVTIFANDRLALGDIVLTVGALSETVTVEAQATAMQTTSADRVRRSDHPPGDGHRDVDPQRVRPRAGASRHHRRLQHFRSGRGDFNANGNRNNQNNYTLDGVTNMDTGSNGGSLATTNLDMIAEMKVITNAQPAEFGRASGAQIQVVTKGGTKDFHGTGYFFHRHEDLNANTWRNNILDWPPKDYRYNSAGFNVGGPVYIPGKINRNKDKLFFFVGIEWQKQLVAPSGPTNVTVPTAAERTGDFSATHDGAGFAPNITIFDPANGKTPFPGNKIPTSRLNADGVKILNWYPAPNAARRGPLVQLLRHSSRTPIHAAKMSIAATTTSARSGRRTSGGSTTRMKPAWPTASGMPATTSRSGR